MVSKRQDFQYEGYIFSAVHEQKTETYDLFKNSKWWGRVWKRGKSWLNRETTWMLTLDPTHYTVQEADSLEQACRLLLFLTGLPFPLNLTPKQEQEVWEGYRDLLQETRIAK